MQLELVHAACARACSWRSCFGFCIYWPNELNEKELVRIHSLFLQSSRGTLFVPYLLVRHEHFLGGSGQVCRPGQAVDKKNSLRDFRNDPDRAGSRRRHLLVPGLSH
jgi:hypothetical protein